MTAQALTQERAVATGSAKPWTMRWLRPIMLSLISFVLKGNSTGLIVDVIQSEDGAGHWASITVDGHEAERRGPYPDQQTAQAVGQRVAAERQLHIDRVRFRR
jgi:hypothetical protein